MSLAVVTVDGRYHGHTPDASSAQKLSIVNEGKVKTRLLTEEEWQEVVSDPDHRQELCSTLGTPS